MESVLIGMSGGVDSSVAAALLKNQGYRVIGATMYLCSRTPAEDAERVCRALGIEHRVLDFRELFKEKVIDYFTDEYKRGRTPNPCIKCNKYLKFGAMLDYALENGIDYVATGHYVSVGRSEDGRYTLGVSENPKKDQSYFLYTLNQNQLKHIIMPLSGYEKTEIRRMARELNIPVAEKPDSQEICFVEDDDYAGFICRGGYTPVPGDFTDTDGNVIGRHRGIIYYTVGQRKGLGAYGKPMFVKEIDAENNVIVLGENADELSSVFLGEDATLVSGERLTSPIRCEVRIRFRAKPVFATVSPADVPGHENAVRVELDTPQRAVTPGQAAVFYDGSLVLGGCTVV